MAGDAARPTGSPFSLAAAVAAIDALLAGPIPEDGPTEWEPGGDDEGWTGSSGAGFRLVPLWESRGYFGVPGPEWDAAQEESEEYLVSLAVELGKRWGPHREVSMRAYLMDEVPEEEVPPLIAEICAFDLYGDLYVWGPVDTPRGQRWVAISVSQCDEDAPHIMLGAVSTDPVPDPDSD
ncbi:hypothetical protein ACWGI8_00070 [Streptomyces sp. NPDC054841]